MKSRCSLISVVLLVFILSSTITSADIIVQYQSAATTELTPDTVATGISAENVTAGSGIQLFSFATMFEWGQWSVSTNSFNESLNANEYWSWGFTVTDNIEIELSDFDISLSHSTNGPSIAEVRAQVNNGTEFVVLTPQTIVGSGTSSPNDFVGNSLSALPALGQGDTVVFTMAAYDSPLGGGGGADLFILNTIDDAVDGDRSIRVNGTITAVPEPGSLAALCWIGMVGFGLTRRRK